MNLIDIGKRFVKWIVIVGFVLTAAVFIILNSFSSFGGKISDQYLEKLKTSAHFEGTNFVNIVPQSPDSFALYWDYLKEQFGGDQIRHPPSPIPVTMLSKATFKPPLAEALKAIWFGHSSVYIELDGYRLMIDPVFSDYASPFNWVGPKRFHPTPISLNELPKIDGVMISHDHYDHLDMTTIQHLAAKGTRFFVPLGISAHLREWNIPVTQITELDWWENASIGTLKVTSTPARHYSGRGRFDYKKTFWSSWSVTGPNHSFFYSGDTGYSNHFKEIGDKLGPFDLSIIKIGAYGPGQSWIDIHMEAEKAVAAHLDVQANYMLPVHWATFNMGFHDWDEPIKLALKAAQPLDVKILTPMIGQVIQFDKPTHYDRWWESVK